MSNLTLREELAEKGLSPDEIDIALTAIRERLPIELTKIANHDTSKGIYYSGRNAAIREMREKLA